MPISLLPAWHAEPPTTDEIAREAYAIYLAKGSCDGHDLDDWLEAERRLLVIKRNAALQPDAVSLYIDDGFRQRHTRQVPDRRRTPRPVVPTYLPV